MSAALELEGVFVALSGRTVVADVTTRLEARSLVALVGPNGAGKTSLMRAIVGLVPHRGAIRLDAAPIGTLSHAERARRIGYLPQGHAAHWPLPARDIVALGRFPHGARDPSRLEPEDVAAVERAMAATDAAEFADRPITELSGGERARIALARVLALEAPIILADEPTASLDPRHQIEVMATLRDAARGGALVIAVTHDMTLAARFADRVLVLQGGRLAADGAPDAALAPEILADVFAIEAFRAERDGSAILVPWRGLQP